MDAIFWFVPAVALVGVLVLLIVLRVLRWWRERRWIEERIITVTGGKHDPR